MSIYGKLLSYQQFCTGLNSVKIALSSEGFFAVACEEKQQMSGNKSWRI